MIVVLIATAAIILGTWLGAVTLAPIVVGLVIGFGWPGHASRRAAAAGFLAWSGLLLAAALRGDSLMTFSSTLGAAMGVPGWALFVATLLYPTVLASSAAWLAQLVSLSRRTEIVGPGAASRVSTPT